MHAVEQDACRLAAAKQRAERRAGQLQQQLAHARKAQRKAELQRHWLLEEQEMAGRAAAALEEGKLAAKRQAGELAAANLLLEAWVRRLTAMPLVDVETGEEGLHPVGVGEVQRRRTAVAVGRGGRAVDGRSREVSSGGVGASCSVGGHGKSGCGGEGGGGMAALQSVMLAATAVKVEKVAAERKAETARGELEQSRDCVYCEGAVRDTLLLPCKHLVYCGACAAAACPTGAPCPICRQAVESTLGGVLVP